MTRVAVETPTRAPGDGVDGGAVTTYKPAMRLLVAGLLLVAFASCASPQAKRAEDPNWRPTSMPTDKTRDHRVPQWKDVAVGEDLIDAKDVKPAEDEAKQPTAKDKAAKDEPAKGEPAKDEPAKDEPAKDKAAPKEEAPTAKDKAPAADKAKAAPKKEEPADKKEDPAPAKEEAAPKKDGAAP